MFVVLSTILQMAGLGFTVGTLAVFLENQVEWFAATGKIDDL